MSEPADLLEPASVAALRPAGDLGWRPPMLATLTDRPLRDGGWLFERKLDGVRALAVRDGGEPRLWSRTGKPMDAAYPELLGELAVRGPARFVADGEIVAFDGEQTSFARLAHRIHLTRPEDVARVDVPVFLYLFDLLALGDVDITGIPLRERKKLLAATFGFGGALRLSEHRDHGGEEFFRQACARGWEGVIAKRAGGPYRSGRSADWLKRKCVRDQEFVVGGFTDPAGTRVGFGALLVGYYEGDRLRYAGKVGTGYDHATLVSLRARLDLLAQAASPFAERVAERGAHWVRPELVAQVGFGEWTADGRLRHPRFLGLRDDKDPREVVRESR